MSIGSSKSVLVYHGSIVAVLDGLTMPMPNANGQMFGTRQDVVTEAIAQQQVAIKFAEFAGQTFTPSKERAQVIGALGRLRDRLVKADVTGVMTAITTIDMAVAAINAQPDKMPAADATSQVSAAASTSEPQGHAAAQTTDEPRVEPHVAAAHPGNGLDPSREIRTS